MSNFLDANRIETVANNAAVLLAGITVLLSFACAAVAAHRSPVHRQRLAEFAIAATLIWALLAVAPLPRPLARGFFAQLSSATARPTTAPSESAALATTPVSGAPEPQSEVASTHAKTPADNVALSKTALAKASLRLSPTLLPPAGNDGLAVDLRMFDGRLEQHSSCDRDRSPCPDQAKTIRVLPGELVFDTEAEKTETAPGESAARDVKLVTVEQRVTLDPARSTPSRDKIEGAPAIASASEQTVDAMATPSIIGRVGSFLASRWKVLLLGAYGLGVAVCAAWIILGRVLLAIIVRTSQPPEEWLDELFADLCDERGTHRVWLLVARRYPRAMSFGIFRPTIVLPAAQCTRANAELLRHVLRHELVHISRRDAWGTWLFNVSFLFLFFHPAFWWLRSRARLSAELMADEWAAAHSSRDEYARELIAFVRATRRATFLPAGATGVLGSTTPFSRRIEMLIRRERPLEMHSSPAWRIVSSGVLGGLIIAMAASLGRTAQDDPPAVDKAVTVHVDATAVSDDDQAQKRTVTVVSDDDEDDTVKVIAKVADDDDENDDDAGDTHKHGKSEVERLQKTYEKLARKSAELQKQMAKLHKALEEAKAGDEHASSTKSHPSSDGIKHRIEKRVIVKDGKGHAFEGDGPGVLRFNVDGKQLLIVTDQAGKDGKSKVSVKTNKKDGKDGEEATIELRTDEGEMILEIGPDHMPKIKKMKGFGKSPADVEKLKKSLESLKSSDTLDGLPQLEQLQKLGKLEALKGLKVFDSKDLKELKELGDLKELGQLKALEQLKDLGDLKELGQLKALEQLKDLGKLQFDIRIQDDGDSTEGKHKKKDKDAKKHAKAEKEAAEKMHSDKVRAEKAHAEKVDAEQMHEEIRRHIEEQVHRAHAQAHKAQMEALRSQLEAKRRELEKLQEKLNQELNEKDGGPSTKRETARRSVIVRDDDSAKPLAKKWIEHKAREQKVAVAKAHAESSSHRPVVATSLRKVLAAEPQNDKIVIALDAASDPMRLAELVSDAIEDFEQAKWENSPENDLMGQIAVHSRMRTAERKLRQLCKIAEAQRALVSAQAKSGSADEQDEANEKAQVLGLIVSEATKVLDDQSSRGRPRRHGRPKSETSVSPTNSPVPATPVVQAAPAAAIVLPGTPMIAATQAEIAVPVPVAAPVAAAPVAVPRAAATPAAVPKPAAVAAPAAAPTPAAPATPAAKK